MAARGSNIHVSLSLFISSPNRTEYSRKVVRLSIKYRMFIFESREERRRKEWRKREKERRKATNCIIKNVYITSTSSKLEIYNQNTSIK